MSLQITPALLAQATGCSPVRAELFAGHLVEACGAYAISATPERLAAFLAQIGHESASLRYVAAWNSAFLPSKDLTEGISAMFAKRKPEFTGE